MAEKKKTSKPSKPANPKGKVGKAPTLAERITDFSRDSYYGPAVWSPAKKKK